MVDINVAVAVISVIPIVMLAVMYGFLTLIFQSIESRLKRLRDDIKDIRLILEGEKNGPKDT